MLPPDFISDPWLESPIRTPVGQILLAGSLHDSQGIGSDSMRILGSHALVLLVEGTGIYRDARGKQIPLSSGHLFHIFPDLPHAYGPGPGEHWNEVYVVFEGPVFSTLRQHRLLSAEHPVDHVGDVMGNYERLRTLFHPSLRPGPGHDQTTFGRFLEFLFEVTADRGPDAPRREMDRSMVEAMSLLATPTEGAWLHSDEIAARLRLSAETFRKRFARAVGIPPARYQKQKKIERACAALYQGPLSLKQLASDLGFFDEFHFSKAFKQIVGQSPSAYRKRLGG